MNLEQVQISLKRENGTSVTTCIYTGIWFQHYRLRAVTDGPLFSPNGYKRFMKIAFRDCWFCSLFSSWQSCAEYSCRCWRVDLLCRLAANFRALRRVNCTEHAKCRIRDPPRSRSGPLPQFCTPLDRVGNFDWMNSGVPKNLFENDYRKLNFWNLTVMS